MKYIKKTTLIFFTCLLILTLVYLVFAWQEPVSPPPSGNVPAPLNVGPSNQIKFGGLILNTGGNEYGLIVSQGKVGIGINAPIAPLHVVGNVYFPTNTRDNCAWMAWTCDAAQTCPSPKFMAGVERYTTGALCGTAPTQWYQMRIYCCDI